MYATHQDMISRFGQEELILLTNKDSRGSVIDTAVLDTAIADASHRIDGYLGGRYDLPLSVVPPVMAVLCCDIARYQLYDDQAPDKITERYDNAIAFLKAVGKGDLLLGVGSQGESPVSQNHAQIQSAGAVFARSNSKGFI